MTRHFAAYFHFITLALIFAERHDYFRLSYAPPQRRCRADPPASPNAVTLPAAENEKPYVEVRRCGRRW